MSQILSQDEVDALLNGVSGGSVSTEAPAADASEARAYDITCQKRIVRDRMPGMDIINEKFARRVKGDLASTLNRSVDILPPSIDVVRFGEFLNTLQVPTNLNIFSIEPLNGYGLLILEASLVFNMVNCFFGGVGGLHTKVEGRDFTQIEQRIINNVVAGLLRDYEASWRPVHPLNIKYVRSEINPRSAAVTAPSETMIVHQFDVELDGATAKMYLCLPYSALEPVSEKLYNSYVETGSDGSERWRMNMAERLTEGKVDVTVELGSVTLNMEEILGLRVGDVIQIDRGADEPLDIKFEGVSKFYGSPGICGSCQAVRITGVHEGGWS